MARLVELLKQFGILKTAGNKVIRQEILRLHLLTRLSETNLVNLADPGARQSKSVEVTPAPPLAVASEDSYRHYRGEAETSRRGMHEHIADIVDRGILNMARQERRLLAQDQIRTTHCATD